MKDTIWLLDVDGVINANRAGWSSAPFKGKAYYKGVAWPMRWSPYLISRIRAVHKNPSVEILWATSWCGHTDQLEELFKLPALRSAWPMRMYDVDKQDAAESVVDQGKRLIWTDDEAIPETGVLRDKLEDAKSLLIVPRSNRGLRPEHLDLIDDYVLGS